jgi:hypothetical protein
LPSSANQGLVELAGGDALEIRIGSNTARLFDRRAYGGKIADEKWMRRLRRRGRARTATGPMPVTISR